MARTLTASRFEQLPQHIRGRYPGVFVDPWTGGLMSKNPIWNPQLFKHIETGGTQTAEPPLARSRYTGEEIPPWSYENRTRYFPVVTDPKARKRAAGLMADFDRYN